MLLEEKYAGNFFEACLLNAPGFNYDPATTNDATVLSSNEVTAGQGGYRRQVIGYESGDITVYSEQGMGLQVKVAVFAHDGGGTALDFTHVALVRGSGNILTTGAQISTPTGGTPGTYENLPTATGGSGIGALVTVVVEPDGTTFTPTIANAGYGYADTDTITISDATLASAGAITAGQGDLTLDIDSVTGINEHAGQLLSVTKTTNPVSLTSGNEAIFYFNLKQFGYSA